jgi:hypothetical protein
MSSINLVSTKVVGLEKELKRLKIFRISAVICLVIVLLLSILAFILNVTLPIETVKKEQQATISGISFFDTKLTQYTLLTDRVKNIANIIAKRADYGAQLSQIFGKIPADSSIDTLNIQTGKISIIISSASLLSINSFLDAIVAFGNEGKILKNVVIQGLTLDAENGKYSLNIQANIL